MSTWLVVGIESGGRLVHIWIIECVGTVNVADTLVSVVGIWVSVGVSVVELSASVIIQVRERDFTWPLCDIDLTFLFTESTDVCIYTFISIHSAVSSLNSTFFPYRPSDIFWIISLTFCPACSSVSWALIGMISCIGSFNYSKMKIIGRECRWIWCSPFLDWWAESSSVWHSPFRHEIYFDSIDSAKSHAL